MLALALLAGRVAPYGYDEADIFSRLKAPSEAHWLGTDNLGPGPLSRAGGRAPGLPDLLPPPRARRGAPGGGQENPRPPPPPGVVGGRGAPRGPYPRRREKVAAE